MPSSRLSTRCVITTSSAPRLEAWVSGEYSDAARINSACVSSSLSSKSFEARACNSMAPISASREQRPRHDDVGLVERGVAGELAVGLGRVLALLQHRAGKSGALHLHQLVDQHVSGG